MTTKTVLTDLRVKNIKPPARGREEHFDAALPGFAMRVTSSGAKSWVCFYRVGGRLRRYTLGRYPALSLAKAREDAQEAMRRAGKGEDAAAEKINGRALQAEPDTFERIAAQFVERYAKPKNRSWKITERLIELHVTPAWGARLIGDIGRRDVIDLLDGLMDKRQPYLANRVLAAVRKLFGWALERGIIDASPVAGVRAPGKETKRDRVLSDPEVVEVGSAAEAVGYPFGALVKLLLLTAQRRDETAGMRRGDVKADGDAPLWTIPREATKSDRANDVPLSPQALAVFNSLSQFKEPKGPYVFTTTAGEAPVSGYAKMKARFDAAIMAARTKAQGELAKPMPGWRLHDLRRTAASGMARLGVAPHVVEKVLNHSTGQLGGLAAVYIRHGFQDEKRAALDVWGRHVEQLVTGKSAKVIKLPRKRA